VDLPGYGYAKVARTERSKFLTMIQEYLLRRESLVCLFLLIDSRLEPQKNDLNFMRWLGENHVPFAICFTKTDKLTPGKLDKLFHHYKKTLIEDWESLPPVFFTSTLTKKGKEEVLQFIEQTLSAMKQ
jgi:GTP-binding protein